MGDVINLNKARKAKKRGQAEQTAAENRILHGRTKEERELQATKQEKLRQHVEGHLRTPGDDDEGE